MAVFALIAYGHFVTLKGKSCYFVLFWLERVEIQRKDGRLHPDYIEK